MARPTDSQTRNGVAKLSNNTPLEQIINEIKKRGNPNSLAGMSRYGITVARSFGVSVPELRDIARRLRANHELALQLWKTEIHEARILAGMIDDPAMVTEEQMENWVSEFDSWDIVDGSCGNLFDKTSVASRKAAEWTARSEEYVKRAGFVLMAEIAVHNKKEPDKTFADFLPLIVRESTDERNFVKKAVNWALRQIGKRNETLNAQAIRTAQQIQRIDSRSARWIASDALRELSSEAVRKRFKTSSKRTKG